MNEHPDYFVDDTNDENYSYFEFKRDQVRMDCRRERLIVLGQNIYQDDQSYIGPDSWVVRDLLSGETYTCEEDRIGVKFYNEMEVLAWSAGEIPDAEIFGD